MANTTLDGNLHITGSLTLNGNLPIYSRSDLALDGTMLFPVAFEALRIADFTTQITSTPSSTALGIIGGTHGADVPFVTTGDVKGLGSRSPKARFLFQLPPEYVTGASVFIRAFAGMKPTVSDGACTIDFAAFKAGTGTSATVVTGSDLVTTSATSIKSLTWGNYDFAIEASTLAAGDWIDILMTIAVTDAATGTEVIAGARVSVSCSIKG